MPIRTIETVVTIGEDRQLVLQLRADVPVGRHRVVAMLDEACEEPASAVAQWTFPIVDYRQWPAYMRLTRAEMYCDDGP